MTKKICIVLGSRANYASIKSFMSAVNASESFDLQLIACCSAVSERYGDVSKVIEEEGFTINKKYFSLIEDGDTISMVRTTGLGMLDLSGAFDELKPDFVLTIGDRYETMATAVAAAYMNIPLIHTMGGEVTGTIDESIRHAITKLSHIHFVANEDALRRVIRLGEHSENVFNVGCPRIDEVARILKHQLFDLNFTNTDGVGDRIDFDNEFILFSYHPVTTEMDNASKNISEALRAIDSIGKQLIILWPNSDAGTHSVSQAIRRFQSEKKSKARFIKNLPMNEYIGLMSRTICMVGNSSSGIREGAYIGTPFVNIGTRQQRRIRGRNCYDVDYSFLQIRDAIIEMINAKPGKDHVYGDGTAAAQMLNILANIDVPAQKMITY